jgi:hypothetical protein
VLINHELNILLDVATLPPLDKEEGLSIAAKPFYKLVEAAGLEPASRKPTSSALHV